MPRFKQISEILRLMGNKDSVRNIGIVAHIDHGKTTMTDSLLVAAGLLPSQIAGSARALDYLEEEQRRGITIKTANISLLHQVDGRPYVVNLVDTPGHVDFTGKVTRALRAIDGVVVVVDAVEEIMAQTETVTRQALEERVKPLLFINKVDRLITELRMSPEDIQNKFTRIIDDFNNLIEQHAESGFKKKWKVNASKETVTFGSALHRWGFTIPVARQKPLKFKDIVEVYDKGEHETLTKLLPLHKAMLGMIVHNGPSPLEAQRYRIPKIWRGGAGSDGGKAMLNCDESGPTVMCITSVQIDPGEGLIATGRLFAGSVKEGDQIYLICADREFRVRKVSIYMGASRENVARITAGNIAAIAGLDHARTGETLVDAAHRGSIVPFESMKYVSEPVMTVAIEPKNPEDLPSLTQAMNRLPIEDPSLAVTVDEKTGEYLLSGIGELHLETALGLLRDYSGGVEVIISNPTVSYREGITRKGSKVTAQSPNRQNRFCVQVETLDSEKEDASRSDLAVDDRGNILIDLTGDVTVESAVKEMIIQGFKWACRTGPLCEQPIMNMKVKLLETQVSEDPALRDPTQVTRTMSRAILGSFLTAEPVLLEPIYKLEVSTPTQWFGECTRILASRRGRIQATENRETLTMITGYVPVARTFGLTAELRAATSGRAFWQSTFDHWEKIPQNIASGTVKQIRIRRGLPPEIPTPKKLSG